MAGPYDPFTPGETGDPTAGLPDRGVFEQIQNQWNTFLDQPGGRAALLSAGLAMMQPPSFGDTTTSQIGRAIGAGGAAVRQTEALDLKEREAESKAALRGAQADTAYERAARMGDRAAMEGEKLGTKRDIASLQADIALNGQYNRYVAGIAAQNAKAQAAWTKAKSDPIFGADFKEPPPTPQQPMSAEEFKSQFRDVRTPSGGQSGTIGGPTSVAPAGTGQYPPAPKNPEDRQEGRKYMTPRGPMTWFSDGWE